MNLKEQIAIQRMYDGQAAAAKKPRRGRPAKVSGSDIPPVQDLSGPKKKTRKKRA